MHPIGRKERGRRTRRFGQNAAPIHPILLWLAEAAQESGSPATITDSVASSRPLSDRHYFG